MLDTMQSNYVDEDTEAWYEPRNSFLTRFPEAKIVPKGLVLDLEPKISNHNEEFLNNWYENLFILFYNLFYFQ